MCNNVNTVNMYNNYDINVKCIDIQIAILRRIGHSFRDERLLLKQSSYPCDIFAEICSFNDINNTKRKKIYIPP